MEEVRQLELERRQKLAARRRRCAPARGGAEAELDVALICVFGELSGALEQSYSANA